MVDSGLIDYWRRKWSPEKRQCDGSHSIVRRQGSERPSDRTERHPDHILPGRPGTGAGRSCPWGGTAHSECEQA